MDNITPLQFWSGIILALIPQVINLIIKFREVKANAPLVEADSEIKRTEAWERLSQEYARQIESLKKLEVENAELRPLVLKLALQEQDMQQIREDKEDWKRYAIRLSKQIEEFGQVPLPFRRTPSDGDTQEKMNPVWRSAGRETPTVVTPDGPADLKEGAG
jgi:hypothetical protein